MAQDYKARGVFDKIIVLLNTSNTMEVDALADYGVDACLWIGDPGTYGFAGVADILSGAANPSGKLVDTYAANSLSAPAVVNFGVFDYANSDEVISSCVDAADFVSHYTVQTEGIYVGYKYYETRYADCVAGRGNAESPKGVWTGGNKWNYADEITYPFGYGLSYTTFSQTLDSVDWNADKTITATVTVTNTGDVAGKSTVELYVSVPYTPGRIEKSAIQLCAFDKTGVLQPGKSETVTFTANASLFASYDSSCNGGAGGYVMEQGDYYFAIGSDVHDALNNVLAKQGFSNLIDADGNVQSGNADSVVVITRHETDSTSYSVAANGARIQNRFNDIDINNLTDEKVTYLSRSDWDKTYPTEAPVITATAEMIEAIDGNTYVMPEDAPATSSFQQNLASGLTLVGMHNVNYEDEDIWTRFIDQLSIADMGKIIYEYTGVDRSVDAVGLPSFINNDGPDGLGRGYFGKAVARDNTDYMAEEGSATCYPNEAVAASTWDVEDWTRRGELMGEDAIFCGVATAWSPGANIHRTPFSGRNFEYFSEDSVLSYEGSAAVVKGMQSKSLISCIKHFVGNDQETQRTGLATFTTEQAFREIDLRAFEGAFVKGGALGTMTSFNRIGCTAVPHSSALLKGVLREEWGFKGFNITDACGSRSYIHSIESMAAGTDMFCMAYESRAQEIISAIGKGDGYLQQCLREANQHIYYALSHSNLINGMSSNMRIITITPWWQPVVIVIDVALGLATAGCAVWLAISFVKSKKNKGAE